ncbi:hypothetical protein HY947_00420 [Candidatus Gottesmanbacteria bacterium]|nr:hypothetical protein [Candidatus Gottesmanbacteria bacterium]
MKQNRFLKALPILIVVMGLIIAACSPAPDQSPAAQATKIVADAYTQAAPTYTPTPDIVNIAKTEAAGILGAAKGTPAAPAQGKRTVSAVTCKAPSGTSLTPGLEVQDNKGVWHQCQPDGSFKPPFGATDTDKLTAVPGSPQNINVAPGKPSYTMSAEAFIKAVTVKLPGDIRNTPDWQIGALDQLFDMNGAGTLAGYQIRQGNNVVLAAPKNTRVFWMDITYAQNWQSALTKLACLGNVCVSVATTADDIQIVPTGSGRGLLLDRALTDAEINKIQNAAYNAVSREGANSPMMMLDSGNYNGEYYGLSLATSDGNVTFTRPFVVITACGTGNNGINPERDFSAWWGKS